MWYVSAAVALLLSAAANAANILCVFPFAARSHFAVYEPLVHRLLERGHNLTVMSHFPRSSGRANLTDVSLVETGPTLVAKLSLPPVDSAPYGLLDNLRQIRDDGEAFHSAMKVKEVQNLLNSNTKFDLLIVELFNTDVFLSLVHKFDAPYVAISPCPLLPWAHARIDNPSNPAVFPNFFSSYSEEMDLLSRASNALQFVVANVYFEFAWKPEFERAARRYFPDCPPLRTIADNVSLVLVNTHRSLHRPPLQSPRAIEVGGIHVLPPSTIDDEVLFNFLETAKEGVVLFSMGSMFRMESLPSDTIEAFKKAFARIPQRVVWKWESAVETRIEGNVLYKNWVPQRDILAHRNVVLFIYHGGLLGVTEAVLSAVPILGIPVFGDMAVNMAAVESVGAGLSLSFKEITDGSLYNIIRYMTTRPNYKNNAVELAKSFQDRPIPPLDEAVYWVEYVIRNRGAPNLRTRRLSWFQLWFVDVALVAWIGFIVLYKLLIYD